MSITKLLLKYLGTCSIIATRFFPKSEMSLEPMPWSGDINLPASEEEREALYFDPSTKYWYLWIYDEYTHVFQLYRMTTYWFWRTCMATYDLWVLNSAIKEKQANKDADAGLDKQEVQRLDKIWLDVNKIKAELINEVPCNQ